MSVCIKDQIQNMNLVIGCRVGCDYCYARTNTKRFHIIEDFSQPEYFPGKLKRMERKKPGIFLLTGMSDLSGWEEAWREEIFEKIKATPHHQYILLTKRPDLLSFESELENLWVGVTVTRRSELWRIKALKENIKVPHYHVTFEPLFDDPGEVDFQGIHWIVAGTMTGPQRKKICSDPEWIYSLTKQAHALHIPVFWKEDLVPVMGEEAMIQELPSEFLEVLEKQEKWKGK